MELKKLVKNTSYLASTKVFQFFAGVIRSKISAVLLGTTGVGVFNQLTFLTNKMSQFSMLGMSDAVVKQIAENKNSKNLKDLVTSSLKSYIILVFTFTVISFVAFIFFRTRLTINVLGDEKYIYYFYFGLFSFPLVIINSIPFAILKGFKDIKSISRARIGIILSNLIVFVPLIYFYKLKGAVYYLPVSYLITLIVNYLITRKKYLKKLDINLISIYSAPFKKIFIKELLLFSGFGLLIGSYSIISEFICRSIVVKNLGVASIGLYSPVITWAGLYIGFIIPTFSTYLFPRFAETKSNMEISGILNDAIRLSTFLLLPLLFLAIPFRDLLISLLYTREFLGAGKYLPYHFIGVIFYVWWYIFSQAMTPTGRIKQHAFFYTLFLTLDIAVTYFAVNQWGLYGWMLKHIVSPFVFFIIYTIYLNRSVTFKYNGSNIKLMGFLLTGSILLIVLDLLKFKIILYVVGPALLVGSWLLFTKEEKTFILRKFKFIVKR